MTPELLALSVAIGEAVEGRWTPNDPVIFPTALLRDRPSNAKDLAFSFYGPTCDDADYMKGPFKLPADIQAGDYIEIGMLGAYGAAMKTGFNGYGNAQVVTVQDEPMMSLFNGTRVREATDNVVSLR